MNCQQSDGKRYVGEVAPGDVPTGTYFPRICGTVYFQIVCTWSLGRLWTRIRVIHFFSRDLRCGAKANLSYVIPDEVLVYLFLLACSFVQEHQNSCSSVAWLPDGTALCTSCDDEEVRIFDLAAGVNKVGKMKQISIAGAPLGAVFLGGKDRIAVLMKGRCFLMHVIFAWDWIRVLLWQCTDLLNFVVPEPGYHCTDQRVCSCSLLILWTSIPGPLECLAHVDQFIYERNYVGVHDV